MAYNFKKETKLYLVSNGNLKYALDIYPDFSVSQTFNETAVKQKTLHEPGKMFDHAHIVMANPANFSFVIPLLYESSNFYVFKLLRDLTTDYNLNNFDLYIGAAAGFFKLERAVIENGTFQITRNSIITLSISGTARKLSPYSGVIPGSFQSQVSGSTFVIPTALEISVNSLIRSNIVSLSLDLSNRVTWLEAGTLQQSLNISDYTGTIYPSEYVVEDRTLSGTIQQYVTDDNITAVNSWANRVPLRIRTGNSSSNWLLDVNIPLAVYTNRLEIQDAYTQSYDFRMTSNSVDLASVLNYYALDLNLGQYSGIWAAI